jgi:catechol 2,3-dioxygenase-like lactoylglutathione lyase family enzyme
MRPQPLVAVRDVEASSRWYQTLLGCESAHGGPEYERLVADGTLVLQLHNWGGRARPRRHRRSPRPAVRQWRAVVFEVDDFDAAVQRAGDLGAEVVLTPHRNPPEGEPGGPAHREIWVKDLDGYTVVLASPDGEAV